MQPFNPYGIPQMAMPFPTMVMRPQMVPVMMAPPGGVRPLGAPPLHLARPITTGPVIVAPPKPRIEKPIALYIGHLTSLVKDDFFKTLLAYCGHMKSWKRVTNSFGFVEYYSPDSALRAMRVLGGRMLLGKSVLVNADKKTKELLDQYTKDVQQGKVRPLTHPGDDAIGKTGPQIMSDQDAVATNLIQTLIATETEKQGMKQDAPKIDTEVKTPSKSPSVSKPSTRSKSAETAKITVSVSTSKSRVKSPSRKRSRSRSKTRSRSRSKSKERRKRSRRRRSRSRSRRSRSRSHSRRHRRKRSRKKRKKERRKRSNRSQSSEPRKREKNEKREKRKVVEKEVEHDPTDLPEPGSSRAPKDAKELVSYIPKDQEKLFQYPIDWELVEKNDLVEKVMRVWIDARIQEYLGEQEADLTNFAVGLLAHHIPPKDIKSEMEMVLVEDAEGFVVKMWRRIIFESLKVKYTIS